MLKTVVLLYIFMETMISFIFQDSLMNRKFKRIKKYFVRLFTVTSDQFNASSLNKGNDFFHQIKNPTDPELLNGIESKHLSNIYLYWS